MFGFKQAKINELTAHNVALKEALTSVNITCSSLRTEVESKRFTTNYWPAYQSATQKILQQADVLKQQGKDIEQLQGDLVNANAALSIKLSNDDLERSRTSLVLQLVIGRGMDAEEARDQACIVYPEAK